jgi:hypothetical protein
MGLEKRLRREPEVQRSGGSYLQAIIVHGDADGAPTARVVPVANRIGDSFAKRQRGICRFIHAFHASFFESPGDRHVIQNESLSPLEKAEGVAVKLAVVEKLSFLRTPEARNPEETLGEVGQEPVFTAEEYDSCAQEYTLLHKPKTAED